MSRTKTTQRGPALYLILPHAIAFDARNHDFDPPELAIIGGILTAAHMARGEEKHAARFAKGALAIKKERELGEKHKEDWRKVRKLRRRGSFVRAPVRHHVHKEPTRKTGRHSRNLKNAGAHAYQEAGSKQHSEPIPDTITLGISRSRLLALSGLSRDGHNLRKLAATLTRLSRSIKLEGRKQPALLDTVREDSAGRLSLEVSGEWFAMHYVRVPLPMPTRSRPALSLYLFSLCVHLRSNDKPRTAFTTLCERIGIALDYFRQRSFDRALDIVNRTLSALDEDALHFQHISLPGRIEVDAEGILVRLRGVPRPGHPDELGYSLRKPKPIRPKRRQAPDFAAPDKSIFEGLALATDERRQAKKAARSANLRGKDPHAD